MQFIAEKLVADCDLCPHDINPNP